MLRRLLAASTVAMLGAAALSSGGGVAPSHAAAAAAPSHPLLAAGPVRLDRQHAQLRLVQVVFRHGARTPLSDETYLWKGQEWDVTGRPYEPVQMRLVDVSGGPASENDHDLKQRTTKLPGGAHKGELTALGHTQALELGYYLRQQYIDALGFLPASYAQGVLGARTTNFARTKATLAGVLTGLYPGTSEAIPVITSGSLDEILYADTKACPHLKVLMQASEGMLKAHWQSPDHAPRLQALQQQLSRLFAIPAGAGAGWEKRWMMCDVHDAITSLAAHGKALPPGLTAGLINEVDRRATEELMAFIAPSLVDEHGHAVLRLSMGRLLDTLLANMDAALLPAGGVQQQQCSAAAEQQQAAAAAGARMFLFSGHDSTVMPLLAALGADVSTWPPYISNLIFELWELQPPTAARPSAIATTSSSSSSGPLVVRVLYNKEPLRLPGATQANPHLLQLQDFRHEVLGPFILSEAQHAEACRASISHDGALPHPAALDEQQQQQGAQDADEWNLAGGPAAAGSGSNSSGADAAQARSSKL